MTSEQVAELKGRLDERCVDGEGINVTREDVEKLLDEREALLEATKDLRGLAYNLLRIVGDSVEKAEAHVSIAGADSAIAKAES